MPENTEINEQDVLAPDSEQVEKPKEKGKAKSKADKKAKASEEIEMLKGELQEEKEKYLRLLAEYDNFRKRSQKVRESIYPEATATALAAIIPVADNFERALTAECADIEFKKGMEMTFKSLTDAFTALNVTAFGEKGDVFDPNIHNAVMQVEEAQSESNTVHEAFQKGYRLGERIIRVAMVTVVN